MINEFNCEELNRQYENGKPFKNCIIDDFFDHNTALKLSNEFPDYNDDKIWAIYSNAIENKRLTPNWGLFPATTYKAFTLMNTPEFIEKIKRITGITNLVADYGMHGEIGRAHV